jgi:hypothetical protein
MKNPNGFYRLHWQARPPAIVVFLSDQLTSYLDNYDWSLSDDTINYLADYTGKKISQGNNLFGEKNFGFGNNCWLDVKNRRLVFYLLRVAFYTDKICPFCEDGQKFGEICLSCNGIGYTTGWDGSKLNDLAATIQLFLYFTRKYRYLKEKADVSLPEQYWVSVITGLSKELSASIEFELGELAHRFVLAQDDLDLVGVNRAIGQAHDFFNNRKEYFDDTNCRIRGGQLFIECPIMRFSTWSKSEESKRSECHNVDGPLQVLLLLIGLCAFCDEAFSFFTKK